VQSDFSFDLPHTVSSVNNSTAEISGVAESELASQPASHTLLYYQPAGLVVTRRYFQYASTLINTTGKLNGWIFSFKRHTQLHKKGSCEDTW
jgi:hypothetical protein